MNDLEQILSEVKNCRVCEAYLPLGPRPVLQMHPDAKILIVGQAPGAKVHVSGMPFDDASGERLRAWMGIDRETFYDASQIAILPMGFCYPGRGKSGDLPPRPECAEKWRKPLLNLLPSICLTLLIGEYAQNWHLANRRSLNLTDTVRNWRAYWPEIVVLPHPSPRNNIWLKKNDWFEQDVLPHLKQRVNECLNANSG